MVKGALGLGLEVLPSIIADERVVAEGVYPSRETLVALSGIVVRKQMQAAAKKACCTPKESKTSSDSAERPKTGCC
ncbi:MAG: arsenic metallochaperone ArsD family protein [Myxococcales bacterium]|nr:arsenic metallochaperone ArsD family protein [Myxococcales bacterium]